MRRHRFRHIGGSARRGPPARGDRRQFRRRSEQHRPRCGEGGGRDRLQHARRADGRDGGSRDRADAVGDAAHERGRGAAPAGRLGRVPADRAARRGPPGPDARHHRNGPHRSGRGAAGQSRLRHEGGLPQPLRTRPVLRFRGRTARAGRGCHGTGRHRLAPHPGRGGDARHDLGGDDRADEARFLSGQHRARRRGGRGGADRGSARRPPGGSRARRVPRRAPCAGSADGPARE